MSTEIINELILVGNLALYVPKLKEPQQPTRLILSKKVAEKDILSAEKNYSAICSQKPRLLHLKLESADTKNINMRYLFLALLFKLNLCSFAIGQSAITNDCTLDSTHFSNVAMYLDTTYMPGQLKYFTTDLFPASKPTNYLCSVILYARVFDKICQKGLDLDTKFSLPERLNIIDLDPSPEKKIYIQNAKTNALIFNCFTDFIHLKTHYDLNVISVYYSTREDAAFERTIEQLVNYGGYTHPTMVKNFLLSKYDKFTLEKYNEYLKELRKF